MKQFAVLFLLSTVPSVSLASNYATCLLDKLPGVQNQAATSAAIQMCQTDHPGGMAMVPQGDGRGFFASYRSGSECTLEKSRETRFIGAAQLISSACHRLYNEPLPAPEPIGLFDDLDREPAPAPATLPKQPVQLIVDEAYLNRPQQVKPAPQTAEIQLAPAQASEPPRTQCVFKSVMSVADYHACDLTPPGQAPR